MKKRWIYSQAGSQRRRFEVAKMHSVKFAAKRVPTRKLTCFSRLFILLRKLLSWNVLMSLYRLAFPGVIILIAFLAYGPQLLFRSLEPHALELRQWVIFNSLVICIWITYGRACFTNPGSVPSEWALDTNVSSDPEVRRKKHRWCRKCEAFKPRRAHHCKICQR